MAVISGTQPTDSQTYGSMPVYEQDVTLPPLVCKNKDGGVTCSYSDDKVLLPGSEVSDLALLGVPGLPPPQSGLEISDYQAAIILVTGLMAETNEMNTLINQGQIEAKQVQMDNQRKEQTEKILEAREQAEKAKKAGKLGQIFAWLGAAASAVLLVCTFGASAPLTATLIVGTALAIDAATGNHVMGKLAEGIANLTGADKDKVMMGLMVATVVVMVAMTVFTGGAAGTSLLAQLGGFTQKTVQVAQYMAARLTAVAALGTGVSTAFNAVFQYRGDMAEVDRKHLESDIQETLNLIDQYQDWLQKSIDHSTQNWEKATDLLQQAKETNLSVTSNI